MVMPVQIVAHRGASFDAPENTLAAERLAWAQGADAVETDVHLTRDGQLVACHDDNTRRTTDRHLIIAQHTLAELRSLDAGAWKGPAFAGEKLPTLDEQVALLPPGKRLFIELKGGAKSVPALAQCVARTGVAEAVITVISFDFASLVEVRRTWPRISACYLAGHDAAQPAGSLDRVDALIDRAATAALSGLSLEACWPLTPREADRIKAAGLELHVWTVDDPDLARHWRELGAATLTTNRPGWLREQLQRCPVRAYPGLAGVPELRRRPPLNPPRDRKCC